MTKEKRVTKNKKKNTIIKNKKMLISTVCILLVVLILIFVISFRFRDKAEVVITIDNIEYTEKDFNMYAYLIKYDYFGIDGTNLSESTLSTLVSSDSDLTIGEYIKEQTISKIKISAAILQIANKNKITLSESDLEEIEEEKQVFIEKLGGEDKFKQLLKDNFTDEETYIEVAKVNKLYSKVFEKLYAKGKRFDLEDDEISKYEISYQSDYVKIKQIILLKKDLDTNEYLDDTTLNQKKLLAQSVVDKAKNGEDFDDLIDSYSEGSSDDSEYYLKTELIEELQTSINSLEVGGISDVISTDNAYHIVLREKLDNDKLEEYLDSKRETKLVEDIAETLDSLAIINSEYLEEIKVR